MHKYAVTGFDERYWQTWGASWLLSLKEFAKHDPEQIIIVGYDLSQNVKKKIEETGAWLLPGKFTGDFRKDTLKTIAEFANGETGIYAYWDADAFFQEDISEVFDLAKDNFVYSSNRNPGFLAGPHYQWMYLRDIQNMMNFAGNDNDLYWCLLTHFDKFTAKVDDTWNFTDVPHLKDVEGLLRYNDKVQKVIHPSGPIKPFLDDRKIVFWERYKDLYYKFTEKKKHTRSHRLVTKSRVDTK